MYSTLHPIPLVGAINNIPILDTIHLEINQQPIGKPGQIDFEIDNLWFLSIAQSFSFPLFNIKTHILSPTYFETFFSFANGTFLVEIFL